MRTQSTIIGIGEAMLAEIAGRSEPAGLALDVALSAHHLGQRGFAISRLGQDLAANELLTKLLAAGLDVSHLQSDPDLPTGRLVVRSIAGVQRRTLTQRAAFDNLQWDFDLVDVAQQADAVVFGMLAQRGGQSQSVMTRFLSECAGALCVFDLTNREAELNRRLVFAGLERADLVIVDEEAWQQLNFSGTLSAHSDIVAALNRPFDLTLVLHVEHGAAAMLHTADASHRSQWSYARETHAAVVVGLIHGLLNQHEPPRCLALAGIAAAHAKSKPGETIAENWDR